MHFTLFVSNVFCLFTLKSRNISRLVLCVKFSENLSFYISTTTSQSIVMCWATETKPNFIFHFFATSHLNDMCRMFIAFDARKVILIWYTNIINFFSRVICTRGKAISQVTISNRTHMVFIWPKPSLPIWVGHMITMW